MAELVAGKDNLIIEGHEFRFAESVSYPNGGISYFYTANDTAVIVDDRICQCSSQSDVFPYSLITDKQNAYMNRFRRVYRFLMEDLDEASVSGFREPEDADIVVRKTDRAENADASPLEMLFENNFTNVYGMDALKYLHKEYGIADYRGNSYFLDYLVRMDKGDFNELTIRTDFFDFLHERDYSLSYKMPFLLAVLDHLNSVGDAPIDDVLTDYIAFYEDRIRKGLPVDRATCPCTIERLQDRSFIRQNMLTNPFEKFERKRFLYYSKDLGMISMNHALLEQLDDEDYREIRKQMQEDLEKYYQNLEE